MGNIALGKTATASNFVMPYTAASAVNETLTPFSRWLCNTLPGWITIDAGAAFWVNRWVIKMMGNAGWASNYNMPAYTLQTSLDNNNWTTVDSVAGNTANTTDRSFATISARYFRISVPSGITINTKLASIMEFEVYDAPAPNGLSSLTLSSGSLTPVFNNITLNYTASVDYDVTTITLTPTAVIANSVITVDGTTVANGTASQPISLNVGAAKSIPVVVTTNGVVKTYTVVVSKNTSAYLTSVTLTGGKTPSSWNNNPFARKTFSYNVTAYATPLTATVKKEDAAAILYLTCNGIVLNPTSSSGDTSVYSVSLNGGSNSLVIKVTSTSGDVKTYTFTIMK